MVKSFHGREYDARYLGYFDCFNQQLFYEAHDVLEDLWLLDKKGADGNFYKGLIQLAGAFVHLQKNRLRPASALFKLSRGYLATYPRWHIGLDLAATERLADRWLHALEAGAYHINPLTPDNTPRLGLGIMAKTPS